MDNLGRDMERMMYILMGFAFLLGGGAVAVCLWIIKLLRG